MQPEEKDKILMRLHDDVQLIKAALMGDEKMGSIGMAQRMVNNEKHIIALDGKIDIVKGRLEEHEDHCTAKTNKIKGAVWVIGIMWTAGVFLIGYFAK